MRSLFLDTRPQQTRSGLLPCTPRVCSAHGRRAASQQSCESRGPGEAALGRRQAVGHGSLFLFLWEGKVSLK